MTEFSILDELALYSKPNTIHKAVMKIIYNIMDYYFKYNKPGHHRTQVTLHHKFSAVLCNLSFRSTEGLWEIGSRLIAFHKHPTP